MDDAIWVAVGRSSHCAGDRPVQGHDRRTCGDAVAKTRPGLSSRPVRRT